MLTPLNTIVIRFTQLGILVKVMAVPLVVATAVPLTIALAVPATNTVPVLAGSVIVLVPATAGAAKVIAPDVSPEITTELILFPYSTTQRLPLETVTVIPLLIVMGPVLDPL